MIFQTLRQFERNIFRQFTVLQKSALHRRKFVCLCKARRRMSSRNITADPRTTSLQDPLVWIDLEMTGLDIKKDTIIEIACILTDGALSREIEGPDIAVHHPEHVFAEMGPWCTEQHNKSGLVQSCRNSTYHMQQAQKMVLDFIKQYVPANVGILAGNSVHADKEFLKKDMPLLHEYLSYRIIDVSTIKELCRRWYPQEYQRSPKKELSHRSLADVQESILELRYYRQSIFKS